jgi:thiamine-phosphate pyrophosphorylase
LLLYYITDRTTLGVSEPDRRAALLKKISQAARAGVDFIQLREKDLAPSEQEIVAREAASLVRQLSGGKTRLVINSRSDIALAAGADGVHLPSRDVSPETVHAIWHGAHSAQPPVVALSCHTGQEVRNAAGKVSFVVFSPVFQNKDSSSVKDGLKSLASACRFNIPVFALGGVTVENASRCLEAGAAGVAGIRLFQQRDMLETVARLRDSIQSIGK